jgi:L-cysteine:1D-myo-inositol 2-amino-2-deoxy-alpha-D-glucopyranoside ligase
MHVAMVRMDGEKMSKSLGNLVFVSDLRQRHDPRSIRLAVIEHHYRDSWEWDDTLMPRNDERLERWSASVGGVSDDTVLDRVRQALDNDLDTTTAVSILDEAVAAGIDVTAGAALLGADLVG